MDPVMGRAFGCRGGRDSGITRCALAVFPLLAAAAVSSGCGDAESRPATFGDYGGAAAARPRLPGDVDRDTSRGGDDGLGGDQIAGAAGAGEAGAFGVGGLLGLGGAPGTTGGSSPGVGGALASGGSTGLGGALASGGSIGLGGSSIASGGALAAGGATLGLGGAVHTLVGGTGSI